jgi:GT2 family glycosyltransferase
MWEQIGLLDEQIFLFLEDADWCRRAGEAGWELWYLPEVEVVHLGGQSFRARSGGHSHHISRERCASLIYYFNKHEPPWKVSLLRLVVLSSLRARLMKLAIRRAAHKIDPETYAADASLLRDALRVTRH